MDQITALLGRDGHGYGFGYKTVDPDPNPENPNPNSRGYGLFTCRRLARADCDASLGTSRHGILSENVDGPASLYRVPVFSPRDPSPPDPTRKPRRVHPNPYDSNPTTYHQAMHSFTDPSHEEIPLLPVSSGDGLVMGRPIGDYRLWVPAGGPELNPTLSILRAKPLQLISDLSQGIRGLGVESVDPGQTTGNRRLITYSKRTRHNRRLGNADSNSNLAFGALQREGCCPAGLGEYSEEDIEEIYECLPAHHRVLVSVVPNAVGGTRRILWPALQQFLSTLRDPLSEIENRRRDTVDEGGKYQTRYLKRLLTRVALIENRMYPLCKLLSWFELTETQGNFTGLSLPSLLDFRHHLINIHVNFEHIPN
ncbi:hypothetical protein B0H14DRAFT_2561930 [Mycena olivaceomarginata]|nr:hypothetical protein B0H14DRAFT_2561930 [Mycena olivaceomarginata]